MTKWFRFGPPARGIPSTMTVPPNKYSFAIRFARFYGHNAPIDRGKRRLAGIAFGLHRKDWSSEVIESIDGTLFFINLTDTIYHELYFFGQYEPNVTNAVRRMIKQGDEVVDIGANFGWFTVLLDRLVGATGRVHSFEPVPKIYAKLLANLSLNATVSRVSTRQQCLGDTTGKIDIYSFAGITDGHSSASTLGKENYETIEAEVTTMDSYWDSIGRPPLTFVKCDVEGSELAVIRGASDLLSSERPPIWLLEANEETSRAMGYAPADLIEALNRHGYDHMILRARHRKPLHGATPIHADSIVAFRPDLHRDRVDPLR